MQPAGASSRAALLALAFIVSIPAARAWAVPPATAAVGPTLSTAQWIEHRVSPGERISEIAALYAVEPSRILTWNKLDSKRPLIRTGHELRIFTSAPSQSRQRETYVVKRGDSWSSIAKRFETTRERVRDQWNGGQQALQVGDRIAIFRRADPEPETFDSERMPSEVAPSPLLPTIAIPIGAQSMGAPDRGRIANAVQIPTNEALYTLRNLDHSWGSSHAIEQLTLGIQRFRSKSGFQDELVIMDMSQRKGGRFRPHESHQAGRDVDIRLPLRAGVPKGTIPKASSLVDWDATWALVRALISTGQVRFIFLARNRQRALYEAAKRAGMSDDELAPLLQYPRKARTAVVRHARGHVKHIHVRFLCGPLEHACLEP